MTWRTVIRGFCALACALAFHAVLVGGAASFGWFSPETTTLPELDLTSIDLSFSETPDEAAAPATPPPQPAVPPTPPVVEPPPPPVVEPPPPPVVEPPPPPVVEPPPPPPQPIVEPLPSPPQPVVEIPPPPPPQPIIEPPPPQPVVEPPPPQPVIEPPPVTELTPPEPTPETKPETKTEPKPEPQPQESLPPQPQPPSIEIPPAPAPSQARVTVDKPPAPRRRIKPEYPKGARERGEEGDVTLEFEVSAKGTVGNVQIVKSCGFPELEQAAIRTVKQARFEPARRGSAKVPSTARLTLTFRLKD